MVDYGTSHNFIILWLVEVYLLSKRQTTGSSWVLGKPSKGVIVGLLVMNIVEGFLPLELGNLDMVLGTRWLRKQGSMTVDLGELAMAFLVEDIKVILKENPPCLEWRYL